MGFNFTKDDKKALNYIIFKFIPKISFSFVGSLFLTNVTKGKYKTSTFFKMFILLAVEEYINSYIPKMEDDKKSRHILFQGEKLRNTAKRYTTPARTLVPSHHEL